MNNGLLTGAVFACLMLAFAVIAMAHPPYMWIMREPGYIAPQGGHCCSTDCLPVDPKTITRTREGLIYEGQMLRYSEPGIYESNEPLPPGGEQRWWRCKRGGQLRCIFRPPMMGS